MRISDWHDERASIRSQKASFLLKSLNIPLEQEIGFWTATFAVSHIGMSAIRSDLIGMCGSVAESLNLINRPGWTLPDIWPGVASEGGQDIFPNTDVAGRQLYRMGYTVISFVTLGSAFAVYLNSLHQQPPVIAPSDLMTGDASAPLWIAVASGAFSIASLFNPSPLSLVPVFSVDRNNDASNAPQQSSSSSTTPLIRDDAQKLVPYGMTRITRHPLILPVVPWGLATALSMGGLTRDWCIFGGLSVYAIAGCAAQDLRIIKEEGSVGTVFAPDSTLKDFYQQTSFLPFGAVANQRQSLIDIVNEVPWWAFGLGSLVSYQIQTSFLSWLTNQAL